MLPARFVARMTLLVPGHCCSGRSYPHLALPVPTDSLCVPILEMQAALQPQGRAPALLSQASLDRVKIRQLATGMEGSWDGG